MYKNGLDLKTFILRHTANLCISKRGDPKERLCVSWEKEESGIMSAISSEFVGEKKNCSIIFAKT